MPSLVVPSLGERTDPATIQAIYDDLLALETDVADLQLRVPQIARKTADETVTSSATLQNDNHLVLTAAANKVYIGEAVLLANSAANAAGDIIVGFSFPASTTFFFGGIGPHNGIASGSQADGEWIARTAVTSGTTNTPYGLSTSALTINVPFIAITSSTAGNLQLMWAQQASNANLTRVFTGSYMWSILV